MSLAALHWLIPVVGVAVFLAAVASDEVLSRAFLRGVRERHPEAWIRYRRPWVPWTPVADRLSLTAEEQRLAESGPRPADIQVSRLWAHEARLVLPPELVGDPDLERIARIHRVTHPAGIVAWIATFAWLVLHMA